MKLLCDWALREGVGFVPGKLLWDSKTGDDDVESAGVDVKEERREAGREEIGVGAVEAAGVWAGVPDLERASRSFPNMVMVVCLRDWWMMMEVELVVVMVVL